MKKIIPLLLIIAGFISCDYAPTETNFHDIKRHKKMDEAVISIHDTVRLSQMRGIVDIILDGDLEGERILRVSGEAGGIKDYLRHTGNKITIDSEEFPDGVFDFQIEIEFKTFTGSLADRNNREYYKKSFNWKTEIYNGEFSIPKIYSHSFCSDGIKLVWNKYVGKLFQKYLIKNPETGEVYYEINNIDQTSVVDSLYGGEKINYIVETWVANKKYETSDYYVDKNWGVYFSCTVDEYNNVHINWRKPKFHKGIKNYKILRYKNIYYNEIDDTIFTSSSVYDTSFVDKGFSDAPNSKLLGKKYQYKFIVNTKHNHQFLAEEFRSNDNRISFKNQELGRLFYSKNNDSFYYIGSKYLTLLDAKTFSVKNQITFSNNSSDKYLIISPNGKHIYVNDRYNGGLIKIDPNTLQTIKYVRFGRYDGKGDKNYFMGKVTNDDILYFSFTGENNNEIVRVDLKNDKWWNIEYIPQKQASFDINSDGSMIVFNNNLFTFADGKFELINDIFPRNSIFINNYLYGIDDGYLRKYDPVNCTSLSQVKVTDSDTKAQLYFDNRGNNISILLYNGYYSIYNPDNFALRKRFSVHIDDWEFLFEFPRITDLFVYDDIISYKDKIYRMEY